MKKSTFIVTLAALSAFAFGLLGLAGCGAQTAQVTNPQAEQEALAIPEEGGVLVLKVNPEFAIFYDKTGKVSAVEARNAEAKALLVDDAEYVGKDARAVVTLLVAKTKDAGFIVEEVEGEGNKIVIEVEDGSRVPSENFLSGIVYDTETYLRGQGTVAAIAVEGESAYGWTDYGDSDYGPDNDGITDYDDAKAAAAAAAGAGAASAAANANNTNYDDGGTTNNNNTNYSNSNYGSKPSSKPSTTKPSKPSSNNTNYDDGDTTNNNKSNYGNTNSGNTNNSNTNYGGNSNNNNTNYDDGGNTNNGNSNYDD